MPLKPSSDEFANWFSTSCFLPRNGNFSRKATDVLNFAYDVAASVESKIKAAGVKLDCDFDSDLREVQMDAGVVRLALINILENALDACVEDTAKKSHKIVFSVKPEDNRVVFEIKDNGTGMDRETRENLFTLFFSSKGNKGTGLGLFIANKIISQHGGKITVDSKPNRGSTFQDKHTRRVTNHWNHTKRFSTIHSKWPSGPPR